MIRIFFAIIGLLTISCINGHAQSKPHFNHTTIYVTDLNRAADFYEKAIQLERIQEPFHDNKHVWFRMGDHDQLHVVSGAKEISPHDINIHLAFAVTNLPDFMKHLDALHVKYGNWAGDDKQIQVRPDKIDQIYLQDPDGYWIEVNNDRF
ncbi:MAG: VOC family protein [Chitinophagales bacterium]